MKATTVAPLNAPLKGSICVSGDKSISHRAVLFAAMAKGTTRLSGVLDSQDVRATIQAVSQLGAQVHLEKSPDGSLYGGITGWGDVGPVEPDAPLDCGNSGTTARLMMGVLAPWDIEVMLTGDASLCQRPMRRVIDPLMRMGVMVFPEGAETLPLRIKGTRTLRPLTYTLPVASAQLKSALLLAGLFAEGETTITEPSHSRNHTELMLPEFGVTPQVAETTVTLRGPSVLHACECIVPGDPSSAAFLVCAAALKRGSAVQIENVALNPSRLGFLRTLERMGLNVSCQSTGAVGKELVGILSAQYTEELYGCEVPAAAVPSLIDEIPVLALVAATAHGITVFRGIGELRVKETDRIAGIMEGLTTLGISAWTEGDDLYIEGDPDLMVKANTVLDSHGDHRLAMTWALVGLCGDVPVEVVNLDSFGVSYPRFILNMRTLALGNKQ